MIDNLFSFILIILEQSKLSHFQPYFRYNVTFARSSSIRKVSLKGQCNS